MKSIVRMTSLSSVFLVVFAGCASLTEGGQAVRLMKADPTADCKELGSVYGYGSLDNSKVEIRNNAAEMGGNYVRWETVESNSVSGTAYKCPTGTAVPASAAVAK